MSYILESRLKKVILATDNLFRLKESENRNRLAWDSGNIEGW